MDFGQRAILCASKSHAQECRIFDGLDWYQTQEFGRYWFRGLKKQKSTFEKNSIKKHDQGGLVEHKDKVFLFGGNDISVEKFDRENSSWVTDFWIEIFMVFSLLSETWSK